MSSAKLMLVVLALFCSLQGLPTRAESLQTCEFDCETNPRYAKLSCEGQLLRCVPDPCCQTETRHLSMAHNELTHLKVLAFRSFPRLKFLDLRQNNIANIAPGAFSNLVQLQLLDIRANHVRHLYAGMFNGLTALKKLYLANNDIESIAPGTFTGMTNLLSLKLNYNHLNSLQGNMFLPLQSLQRLYIYGNQIANVNEQAFRGLTNLVTLSLAENSLVTFPNILPYLPEIVHIRLHNTPLKCDCHLEFLRVWLRENLYDAYESYAICSQPHHLHGTPIYRVTEPLHCNSRPGNLPISHEASENNQMSHMESAVPRGIAPSMHSESESDYSEIFESSSDLSQVHTSKTVSTNSKEGGVSRPVGSAGRDTSRAEPETPSTTLEVGTVEPLTPNGTVSPGEAFTSNIVITGSGVASTHDFVKNVTASVSNLPVSTAVPTGEVPAIPATNVSTSGSRFNGSFNELPRPPPRKGGRRENTWFEGERSHQVNQDDSHLPTASSTDPFRSPPVADGPSGPPQAWGLRGSSVTIDCPVHIHNMNESKIKWLTPHGKLVMSNVSRYAITKRGSLVIHSLQAHDHGTYRCIVRKAMNSVKMLPTRLVLACPCHHKKPREPSFEPAINATGGPHYGPGSSHPHEFPPHPHDSECSPVPMVVAIVTTFQATVALCVITFCLCCSKNLNYSIKERTCTGVPEPIAVVRPPGKFDARSRDFSRLSEPVSSSVLNSRGSESYEALTDCRFAPRQASSIRSYDSYYESHPNSEYVNYRRPKNYMYMIGYMDSANGRRAIGYRSSTESQCASIKEISNENIYVSKD